MEGVTETLHTSLCFCYDPTVSFPIDEPKTPYHYSDSEDDASAGATRPRRVSLVGGAVDPEELSHGLAHGAPPKFQAYEPGSGPEEEEDESEMTAEQIGKRCC